MGRALTALLKTVGFEFNGVATLRQESGDLSCPSPGLYDGVVDGAGVVG
jgi:hypothetical protein